MSNIENVSGNLFPIFVLLLVIKRFSIFYKIRVNDFAISRSSFKIIFSSENIGIARKFFYGIKKNFIYWNRTLLKIDPNVISTSKVVQLQATRDIIKCSIEILNPVNDNIVSSLNSHYNGKNVFVLAGKHYPLSVGIIFLRITQSRSRLRSCCQIAGCPSSFIDLGDFLNLDTSIVDSIFSFETFKEIVNLHIK